MEYCQFFITIISFRVFFRKLLIRSRYGVIRSRLVALILRVNHLCPRTYCLPAVRAGLGCHRTEMMRLSDGMKVIKRLLQASGEDLSRSSEILLNYIERKRIRRKLKEYGTIGFPRTYIHTYVRVNLAGQ